ncbi:MAG: tetratricopeptide repeat protein [Gemmatimonadota bacterium]
MLRRADRSRLRAGSGWLVMALTLGLTLGACAEPSAIEKGDRLMAAVQVDAAIAEYKLAQRQLGDDPEVLLRLGSAYGQRGDVEASLGYFRQVLAADTTYRYRVASELIEVARGAQRGGSLDNMARALQPLQDGGLGLISDDLKVTLAEYYQEQGDYAQALPLYLVLLDSEGRADSVPADVWLQTGHAFKEMGGCAEALRYYETFLEFDGLSGASLTEARWNYGECLYEVADKQATSGRRGEARQKLDRLIDQGVPRTVLDRGYFLRGELRVLAGELSAAQEDFQAVLDLNPSRTGRLAQLAEQRLREIRF